MSRSSAAHKALKRRVALAVGQLPFARAFVRETGQGRVGGRRSTARNVHGEVVDYYDGEQPIRFGIVGGADVEAFVAPFGRHVELECKTGTGKPSAEQALFSRAVLPFGVRYLVVRDEAEAVDAVWAIYEEDVAAAQRAGFVVDMVHRRA